MKKQPKLILRESAVFDMTKHLAAGSFVEMGAGTGHMASLFLERGFHGACHDLGASSRQLIRNRFAHSAKSVQVVDSLSELPLESFDFLFAFEVLEHIDNDGEVLSEWLQYLKPGGTFVATVPAHQKKFGASDHLVGHVRRYEKDQMRDLLSSANLREISIINYGFPITELTRTLSNKMIANDKSYENLNQQERSILSAQRKPKAIQSALSRISDKLITPFCHIQRYFYRMDLGDGLVIRARK